MDEPINGFLWYFNQKMVTKGSNKGSKKVLEYVIATGR